MPRVQGPLGPARPPARRLLQWALFTLPVVIILVQGLRYRCVVDDGFIYLRVVRNVVEGHGPVFNIGQRVEAYTGPLWVAILAIADVASPFRLEWIAVGVGIASTIGGVVLAMLGAARLTRDASEPDALLAPAGMLVFAVLPATWYFASSGLETGLIFLWLGACLWVLARWSDGTSSRLHLGAAMVLGLGWLVHPELVLYSVAFLLVVGVGEWRRGRRHTVALLLAAVALPAVYQVFRMGYFGQLVANTAIAKEGTRWRWHRGWLYLRDLTDTYWLWFPVLVLVLAALVPLVRWLARHHHRRRIAVVVAFVGGAVVNALYIVAAGGDYMHARLLLPPFFALCAPFAVVAVRRRFVVAAALVPWLLASLFLLRPSRPALGGGFVVPLARHVTLADSGLKRGGPGLAWHTGPGVYIEKAFAYSKVQGRTRADLAATTVGSLAIGASSYALPDSVDVLDLLGLADPLTAHLRVPIYTGLLPLPGHEKQLPEAWIAARLLADPGSAAPTNFPSRPFFPLVRPATGAAWQRQVRDARGAALRTAPPPPRECGCRSHAEPIRRQRPRLLRQHVPTRRSRPDPALAASCVGRAEEPDDPPAPLVAFPVVHRSEQLHLAVPIEVARDSVRDALGLDDTLTGAIPGTAQGSFRAAVAPAADGGTDVELVAENDTKIPFFGWFFALVFRFEIRRAMKWARTALHAAVSDSQAPQPLGTHPLSTPGTFGESQSQLIATVAFAGAITAFAAALFGQLSDPVAKTFHASNGELGGALAITRLGALIALVAAGLADRLGRRRILLGAVLGVCIASGLSADRAELHDLHSGPDARTRVRERSADRRRDRGDRGGTRRRSRVRGVDARARRGRGLRAVGDPAPDRGHRSVGLADRVRCRRAHGPARAGATPQPRGDPTVRAARGAFDRAGTRA